VIRYILIFFSFFCLTISNAVGQCDIINSAFKNEEKIEYEVVYNWGFIWIPAGKVTFRVKSNEIKGRPIFQIYAYGNTYKGYDWFFKVRDTFRTYIDTATMNPLWSERNSNEGNYIAKENYVFDESVKKIYIATQTSKKPYHLDTLKMKGCIYDILTAAFHARNINYAELVINEKFPLWTLIDGKVYPIYIRYLGKEVIVGEDKQKYNCIKLSSAMIEGTIFKSGEELNIWITDDKNHVPILVEAKIIVGSVKALFKSSENLRNPFTSKIN
jgi:hypothetical protein